MIVPFPLSVFEALSQADFHFPALHLLQITENAQIENNIAGYILANSWPHHGCIARREFLQGCL
jgi:hypothetical protein